MVVSSWVWCGVVGSGQLVWCGVCHVRGYHCVVCDIWLCGVVLFSMVRGNRIGNGEKGRRQEEKKNYKEEIKKKNGESKGKKGSKQNDR